MRKVVVDTDAGVDDALALMLLAADPEVELLAVLSVFGSASSERTADNARYVLDTCGRGEVPVFRGAAAPLRQTWPGPSGIHGTDGFGDTGLRPRVPVPAEPDAVVALLDAIAAHPDEIDYVALGPLTNLATAMRRDASLVGRLRTVTVLGSLGPARGDDAEPWTDPRFRVSRDGNVSRDIDAAEQVAGYRGDVTWCGPYVTRQVLVPEDLVLRIAADTASAPAELIARIGVVYADFYTRSYPQPDGARVMGVNDSIAVASLLRPELVTGSVLRPLRTFEDARTGERYLAGVHAPPDDARPVHRIVTEVDVDGVVRLIGEVLRRPLPWR